MAKLVTMFTLVLLLSLGQIHASRLSAAFHGGSSPHGGAAIEKAELDEGSCDEGVEGKEECLMRRTLAAHLDYIYTQNHKP